MAIHRKQLLREKRRRNRSKKTSWLNPSRLRLVVYRSIKHFEAQIINDFERHTMVSVSSRDKDLQSAIKKAKNKIEISSIVGEGAASIQNPTLGWIGSLTNLEGSKGYWFIVTEDIEFQFIVPDSRAINPKSNKKSNARY